MYGRGEGSREDQEESFCLKGLEALQDCYVKYINLRGGGSSKISLKME